MRIADSGEPSTAVGSTLRELDLQPFCATGFEQCRDVLRAELVERLAHLHELHEIVSSQLIAEGILDRDIGVIEARRAITELIGKAFAGTQVRGRILVTLISPDCRASTLPRWMM